MFQTICFHVVRLENVLLCHAFSGPQPLVTTTRHHGRFGTKCLLWCHLATSVTTPSGSFSAFLYILAQSRKLPSFSFVSNSGQIWYAVQNGEKSNLPGLCTVLELHRHSTKVWLDRSSWIFHTIFCCRFPLYSLGNTLPYPQFFGGGVEFQFLEFAISSYLTLKLSTDVFYQLFVWGRRYPPPSTPNTLSVFRLD